LRRLIVASLAAVGAALAACAADAAESQPKMATAYPGLVSDMLGAATLGGLPEGVLARAGGVEVTQKAVDYLIDNSPRAVRNEMRQNALFLLDELVQEKLLLAAAKDAAAKAGLSLGGKSDRQAIGEHLNRLFPPAKPTEAEMAAYLAANRGAFGDLKLSQVRDEIEQTLKAEKRQKAVARYAVGLAEAGSLTLSAAWVKDAVALALDNPVDKARASGKPSLVDFGAKGCIPCDKLAPILKTLAKKYDGKANVVFVHVREQPILATRHRIESIPTQVFYDKQGSEVSRHVGFLPQKEIEKKLSELGVE
jgi:thioredoxin 1